MNPGERFIDARQRVWTLGSNLGQGTWSRSYLARAQDGEEAVLQLPLREEDWRVQPDPARLASACRRRMRELAERYRSGESGFIQLLSTVSAQDGTEGLLLKRAPSTLARRMESGAPLSELLLILERVAALLPGLREAHGHLHPANVLLDEAGLPRLADPFTPAARELPAGQALRPPEAPGAPGTSSDTWAVAALVFLAVHAPSPGADGRRFPPPPLPRQGLDKVELATLRDRISARLQSDKSNPRFRGKLAQQLASVLNRALSLQTQPSPPFRFDNRGEFNSRLSAAVTLLDPRVKEVGRLLLGSEARNGVFLGDGPVSFSVTVACSEGVESKADLVCGLQVIDLDAPEGKGRVPVQDAEVDVTSHPSGRMRFGFRLAELPPGRYRVKVAFSVKDGGQPPDATEGHFELRPPPGWVPPPREEVQPPPLVLRSPPPPEDAPTDSATDPSSEGDSQPGAPVVPLFDRPVPRSSDGPRPLAPPEEPPEELPAPPPKPLPLPRPAPTRLPEAPPEPGPRATAPAPRPVSVVAPPPPQVEVEIDLDEPDSGVAPERSTGVTLPQARPPSVNTNARTLPNEEPPSEPSDGLPWNRPGSWSLDAQDEEDLPNPFAGGTDLTAPNAGDGDRSLIGRWMAFARRSQGTALAAAGAVSLVFVGVTFGLLRACS